MAAVDKLNIVDIRHLLARGPSRFLEYRPLKQAKKNTLHYNGQATNVAANIDAEIRHFQFIAQYHVNRVWDTYKGQPVYGHGIMYDHGVGPSGTIYRLRDLTHVLWHCANRTGNLTSLATHIPIGDWQRPTDKQWESATKLFQALADDHGFNARSETFGHNEWSSSACPGPVLIPMLEAWRTEFVPVLKRYRIKYNDAKCRQGPGLNFPVAATFQAGHEFDGKIVIGQSINGNNIWYWRADGRGMIHSSLCEEV